MEVRYWKTSTGRSPVVEFIAKQPDRAAQRIMKSIKHFADQGMNLLAYSDKVKGLTGYKGLYELRVDFRGVFYRIIFCIVRGTAYLLLAFKKKGNQTRPTYIKTALTRQQQLMAHKV